VSKRKHKHQHHICPPAHSPAAFKQKGLSAFRRGDFNAAIDQWSRLDVAAESVVRSALAEAHFRRALSLRDSARCLSDLSRSVELMPGEGRYWYHKGLAHHRADQLDEAIAAYARAAETGASFSRLGFVRGLAEVERHSHVDLESLNGLSTADRAALLPIAALLRNDPQAVLDAQPGNGPDQAGHPHAGPASTSGSANRPASMLWRGLALLATGQTAQALSALTPSGHSLKAGAEAVRAYYHGLALAATGDPAAALAEWAAAAARTPTSRLQAAVAGTHLRQARAAIEAGQWPAALASVDVVLKLSPRHSALTVIQLIARNRLASECAARGEWAAALPHWQHLRTCLEGQPDLGPITPVLQNLAIAHERLEQWEAAAEAWSALLSKLPRRPTKKAPEGLRLSIPEFRAWLRRRVLECYRRAGRPDQAIAHYRNAVKANPDDLDLRLELADALLANEQVIAGRNELERILQKDPAHLDARVRLAEVHRQRGELYAAEQELRAVLETDPQHALARRGLVDILCERGHAQFNVGTYSQAKKIYEEALPLTPDDPQLLVWLGNTELALRQISEAREHFDAAMAKGDLHTYVHIFGCWARRDNVTEARRILERAEAAGVASPHFYVDVAGECFQAALGVAPSAGFLSAAKTGHGPWDRLGREMLQKAESTGGDSAESLRHVVAILGPVKPDLALEYARKLAHRTPDDPRALLQLGVLQGITGQTSQARDSLRRAAHLARRRGDSALLEEIQDARYMIDNPLADAISRMGLPFGELDDEDYF
jgi:tetratricopeptide (TPR) repeat protein